MFRIERYQVRCVPMIWLGLVKVFEPLLQLAMLANLQWRQTVESSLGSCSETLHRCQASLTLRYSH